MQKHATKINRNIDWQEFLGRHDMTWVVKPVSWDEGAFIGNGLIGAMVYGEENIRKRNVLRFVIGRTDVTAHRENGFSPRVPIGELELEMEGFIYHPTDIRVDLFNAELTARVTTTKGEVHLRSFVHSEQQVLTVEIETSEGEQNTQFVWYANPEVHEVLKYTDTININQYIPDTSVEKFDQSGLSVCVQTYPAGDGCTTAYRAIQLSETRKRFFLTVANGSGQSALDQAVREMEQANSTNYQEFVDSHRKWWHDYYQQSFISIPDTRLESFYWIQMYKLASATRKEHKIIDNQGPWLTTTPWPGLWFNMNVQMSYSPVYTSNRLEIGESLCRALDDNFDNLIRNAPEEFQFDSSALGRSMSYDLVRKLDQEIGNLTWTCHNYWRQYRHEMDDDRLRNNLYPLLRRSINFYLHILEEDDQGKLHLPPSISPEYGSFFKLAVRDCHYDLALLRWGCQTLLSICERLSIEDPLVSKWEYVLEHLTDFPVDETGFMVGKEVPLEYGHRHFSHLLSVFPLHIICHEQEQYKELIYKSFRHWIAKEGDLRGFSFTGAASIAASLGLGQEALQYIKTLLHIIKPNTMYKEAGPVIETPLAGAESIHDLLLQSWGDTIRIFPAVPDDWQDVVFDNLRAEGAFLISAVRKSGQTQWIRVQSLAGEPCRIQVSFNGEAKVLADRPVPIVEKEPGVFLLGLEKGEEVVLYAGEQMPDLTISPLAAQRNLCNYFGGHKPWRLYDIPVMG